MKQYLMALFSQNPIASLNRVMAMMVCLVGCYVVIDGLHRPIIDYVGITTLSTALFTIATGSHVLAKYSEVADHKLNIITKTQEVKDDQ
jgi:multisubunit Na+/H+ antiporter MnhB subunit